MTEAEWLACDDPQKMLDFLRGKASDRKLRLFACACCRRIWHLLVHDRSRNGIEVAEKYADGVAKDEELDAADDEVSASTNSGPAAQAVYHACFAPYHNSYYVYRHAFGAATKASAALASNEGTQGNGQHSERAAQVELLNDIFGNLFRPITSDPAWQTPTVTSLAAAAYEERSLPSGELEPARLAVLADALEEAGCREQSILDHLRSPGPHVRGCWTLDLILGRV
jgi:hypothetical protein